MHRLAARVIATGALLLIWPLLMLCTVLGVSALVAQAIVREWSA